jgi:hypothetical protein
MRRTPSQASARTQPINMREMKMWELAKHWLEITRGLTSAVALLAVLVAWRQLTLNRVNQRETTAKTTFREYLKLAVQHPEFACADYKDLSDVERERYEWLVGYLLWSIEELLEFKAGDDVWTKSLRLHLSYHRDYLASPSDFKEEEFQTYSRRTQDFIDQTIKPRTRYNPQAAHRAGQG